MNLWGQTLQRMRPHSDPYTDPDADPYTDPNTDQTPRLRAAYADDCDTPTTTPTTTPTPTVTPSTGGTPTATPASTATATSTAAAKHCHPKRGSQGLADVPSRPQTHRPKPVQHQRKHRRVLKWEFPVDSGTGSGVSSSVAGGRGEGTLSTFLRTTATSMRLAPTGRRRGASRRVVLWSRCRH